MKSSAKLLGHDKLKCICITSGVNEDGFLRIRRRWFELSISVSNCEKRTSQMMGLGSLSTLLLSQSRVGDETGTVRSVGEKRDGRFAQAKCGAGRRRGLSCHATARGEQAMEWTSLLVAGGVARWPDLSWSAWAVATSALLAAAYLMWSWSRFVRLIEALPGPRGVPLLGVTFDVEHDHAARIQQTHRRWVERYGPIYRAWIGPVVMVAIASPQLMEPILSSPKLITKGFGYSFLRAWLGDAIFLSTGRSWKDRRRMLTPAFHFQILQQFVDTFNEHSRAFCRQLQRWIDDRGADQPFDAYPVVTQCALDIICGTNRLKLRYC